MKVEFEYYFDKEKDRGIEFYCEDGTPIQKCCLFAYTNGSVSYQMKITKDLEVELVNVSSSKIEAIIDLKNGSIKRPKGFKVVKK